MFSLIVYIALSGQLIATPVGSFDTMKQCELKAAELQKRDKTIKNFKCFDNTRTVPVPPVEEPKKK